MIDGERIIFFDGLGNIIFKKSKRSRRLTIRVKSHSEVVVTLPYILSYKQAEAFVVAKSPWIKQTREKLKEKTGEQTIFHDLSEFSTRNHVLKIERTDGETVKRKIGGGKILISVPFEQRVDSAMVQGKIRAAIVETWRKEARQILPGRLNELAAKFGFQYRGISIKNMKTRWGSCTGKNDINLNLHLVRLPEHLSDYIILHELVHTVHKNHGVHFWSSLDKLCGDAKGLARELKNYRLEIW